MSQQHRKQNTSSRAPPLKNQKNDNSSQSKRMATVQSNHPSRKCAPIVPGQQQSATGNQPSTSNKRLSTSNNQVEQSPNIDFELGINPISNMLDDFIETGCARQKSLVNGLVRDECRALQLKVKKGKTELKSHSEILTLFEEVQEYILDRWDLCEKVMESLDGDRANKLDSFNADWKDYEQINDIMKKETEEGDSQENVFTRRHEMTELKLDKVNSKVDFETKIRDNICIQISEMNRNESKMVPMIDDFRKSNEHLKVEINLIEMKFEDDNSMASNITANATKWISEKRELISTLNSLKSKLKSDKKSVSGSLKMEQTANKKLCKEIEISEKESKRTEEQIAAEQKSQQLLIETANAEFEQKRSLLSDDLEKITSDTKQMQSEADKKQSEYDEYKQTIEAISTLHESIKALEEKIPHLENEKWKQEHKVSIIEEYINEIKNRRSQKQSIKRARDSKRQRLSSSKLTADDVQSLQDSGSSYDVNHFSSMKLRR